MTLLADQPVTAPARPSRTRPWLILVSAVAVVALSITGTVLQWPAWLAGALLVAAVLITAWGAWVAVRRPSLFVAPLAVCALALGNPVSLAGFATNVEAHAGVITVRTSDGFGLVFWKLYPGVAGWTPSADPQPVDTVAFTAAVQAGVRSVVDTMSKDFGLEWSVAQQPSGLTQLPNGFGGMSLFDRIDSAVWHTALDGSEAQRRALVAATRAAASTLELSDEQDAEGDVSTGDGTTTWSDEQGALTLVVADDVVTVSYTGGPLLSGRALPGEYEQLLAPFAGLTPPAPLVVPDVPRR